MKRSLFAGAVAALVVALCILALESRASEEPRAGESASYSAPVQQPPASAVETAPAAASTRAVVEPKKQALLAPRPDDPYVEAKQDLASERAILIDVSPQSEWNGGHLAGAISFPLSWLQEYEEGRKPNTIPQDKIIYVYGATAQAAKDGAAVLSEMGFDARPLEHSLGELGASFELVRLSR